MVAKKSAGLSADAKRQLIEADHADLSIRRQCELLGPSRASYYYQATTETPENLHLMRLIDEQYLKTPFYGYLRMTAHLRRTGLTINPKRTRRLMRLMGLVALYPKPKTTVANPEHRVYPYLLRGLAIVRPNQVWSADGHHLLADGARFYVPGGCDRLAQSLRVSLATFQHAGRAVLSSGVASCPNLWEA